MNQRAKTVENIVIELIVEQTRTKSKRKRCVLQRIGELLSIVIVTISDFVIWLTEFLLTKSSKRIRRPKKHWFDLRKLFAINNHQQIVAIWYWEHDLQNRLIRSDALFKADLITQNLKQLHLMVSFHCAQLLQPTNQRKSNKNISIKKQSKRMLWH